MELELRLGLRQVMAPQLIQSLKMLQMPILKLSRHSCELATRFSRKKPSKPNRRKSRDNCCRTVSESPTESARIATLIDLVLEEGPSLCRAISNSREEMLNASAAKTHLRPSVEQLQMVKRR